MDLTPAMQRFRECARHTWNAYFQPMANGWHEFINVEQALFSGLVLSQFERAHGLWQRHPDGYDEAIAVIPIPGPLGLDVLHVRDEGQREERWTEVKLHDAAVDLRFIAFFDFANYADLRNFKWVRARAVGPPGHPLLRDDVLIEAEDVRFETRPSNTE
jgi:hypothetical protein